jgi:hypothetical protein
MEPLYIPYLWNVLQATLDGQYRTNNNLDEGWNSTYNSLINQKHPSVFVIVEKFQKDYTLSAKA